MITFAAVFRDFLNGWLVGACFFTFIFLGFLSGLIRAIQSRTWPRTEGTILESGVEERTTSGASNLSQTTIYTPTVRYRYEVDGKPHESTQIAIGVVSGAEAAAIKICAKYPTGTKVPVFHHPRLHYLAVLEPGRFVLPLLATLITAPVAYAIIALWISKSVNPTPSPWKQRKHTSIGIEQASYIGASVPGSLAVYLPSTRVGATRLK